MSKHPWCCVQGSRFLIHPTPVLWVKELLPWCGGWETGLSDYCVGDGPLPVSDTVINHEGSMFTWHEDATVPPFPPPKSCCGTINKGAKAKDF